MQPQRLQKELPKEPLVKLVSQCREEKGPDKGLHEKHVTNQLQRVPQHRH